MAYFLLTAGPQVDVLEQWDEEVIFQILFSPRERGGPCEGSGKERSETRSPL